MVKPADPARLFLQQANGGLNLPLPSALYEKLRVGKLAFLLHPRMLELTIRYERALKKESQQKQVKFQPHIVAQETFAADPGMSGKLCQGEQKGDLKISCKKNAWNTVSPLIPRVSFFVL